MASRLKKSKITRRNVMNTIDKLPGNPIKQWIYAHYDEDEENWVYLNMDREYRSSMSLEGITFTPVGLFIGVCFNGIYNADYSICSFDENYAFDKILAEKIAYGRATEGLARKKRAKARINPELCDCYLAFIERCQRYYKNAVPSERVKNAEKSCLNILHYRTENDCDEYDKQDFCSSNGKYHIYDKINYSTSGKE